MTDEENPVDAASGGISSDPSEDGEEQTALEAQRARADSNMAGWQRAQADFQNYKRRTEQERGEASRYGSAPLLLQCLTTVDDLERAFMALPPSLAQLTWVEGIALIYRKLQTILESQGVREMEAEGQDFDPQLHEAIAQGDGPEGKVVQVVQKGYYLYERVLRPALVQVGNETSGSEKDLNSNDDSD